MSGWSRSTFETVPIETPSSCAMSFIVMFIAEIIACCDRFIDGATLECRLRRPQHSTAQGLRSVRLEDGGCNGPKAVRIRKRTRYQIGGHMSGARVVLFSSLDNVHALPISTSPHRCRTVFPIVRRCR